MVFCYAHWCPVRQPITTHTLNLRPQLIDCIEVVVVDPTDVFRHVPIDASTFQEYSRFRSLDNGSPQDIAS